MQWSPGEGGAKAGGGGKSLDVGRAVSNKGVCSGMRGCSLRGGPP